MSGGVFFELGGKGCQEKRVTWRRCNFCDGGCGYRGRSVLVRERVRYGKRSKAL